MKWKQVIAGVGVGIGAGVAIGTLVEKYCQTRHISSHTALKKAKEILSQKGSVTGSWINMTSESFTHLGTEYDVFHGGVSLLDGEITRRFEFYIESKLGTILHISEVRN